VDAILFAIIQKLRRRAIWMKLDLVNSWNSLAAGIDEKLLKVLDAEI
jgi:hypothetical protein